METIGHAGLTIGAGSGSASASLRACKRASGLSAERIFSRTDGGTDTQVGRGTRRISASAPDTGESATGKLIGGATSQL